MIIKLDPLSPVPGTDPQLELSVAGSILTLNSVDYDFSALQDGAYLPLTALPCEVFSGPARREGGEIILELLFPCKEGASEAARFPVPIHVTVDGPVALPE
jgi:hypothetical protein